MATFNPPLDASIAREPHKVLAVRREQGDTLFLAYNRNGPDTTCTWVDSTRVRFTAAPALQQLAQAAE